MGINRKRKYSEKLCIEIALLYKEGLKPKELSNKFNIPKPSIDNILREQTVERHRKERNYILDKPEKVKQIIEMYIKGTPYNKICKLFNISNSTIHKIISINNIERNKERLATYNKKEKVDFIISEYVSGKPAKIIANKLNISISAIYEILKRNNIQVRSNTECHRKYKLNKTWFDNIDSEDKAYFLGLMWTDGNVDKRGSNFNLSFKEEDKYILEYFSKIFYFGAIGCIYTKKRSSPARPLIKNLSQTVLDVNNSEMTQKLIDLGCVPNKTFITRFPQWLDKALYKHFIRGLIDGDGCITICNKKQPLVSFTGTLELIQDLLVVFNNELNIKKILVRRAIGPLSTPNANTYVFSMTGFNKIKKFLDWIYQDATIYFTRKKDKYITILEMYKECSKMCYLEETKTEIYNMRQEGKSVKEICSTTGKTQAAIRGLLRRYKLNLINNSDIITSCSGVY